MFDKIKTVLDGLNTDDVTLLINDIKDYVKDRKTSEKDAIVTKAKDAINVGDTVLAKYKDAEVVGTVTKKTDKGFSMKTVIDGASKTLSRGFHLYVGHTDAN
jgi:hypothetical protein